MLKLSELKISPAPWRQEANGYGTLDVLGSDDSIVVAYENPINRNDQENRRLIAAAPKLYKKAYEVAENLLVHLAVPTQTITMNRAEIAAMYKDLLDALAEAAGESDVNR